MELSFASVSHYKNLSSTEFFVHCNELSKERDNILGVMIDDESVVLRGADFVQFLKDLPELKMSPKLEDSFSSSLKLSVRKGFSDDLSLPSIEDQKGKTFAYYERAKEQGDAEGNPVKELILA